MPGFTLVPALVSLTLHGIVLAVLLIGLPGLSDTQPLKEPPRVIHAKLVVEPVRSKPAPAPKPAPKPKPKPKSKPEPKPEPKPVPKPEPKPKPVPKKGPTPEELRRKKAEDAAKAKAEEQARLEALQEELQRQQEDELAAALASEDAMLEEAELVSSYQDLIVALVQRNWTRPPSARNGMSATVGVEMLPTGEIHNADIVEGSGDEAFDRSAIRAVKGLGRIDELGELGRQNPAVFERQFRKFNFVFKPTDLRR